MQRLHTAYALSAAPGNGSAAGVPVVFRDCDGLAPGAPPEAAEANMV